MDPLNENGEGGTPEPTTNPGEGATPPSGEDRLAALEKEIASLKSQNTELASKNEALSKETIDRRHKLKEEQAQKLKQAEEAQEFKKAYELLKGEIDGFKSFETDAQKWREYESKEMKRIEEISSSEELPALVKIALESAGTLQAKSQILSEYAKQKTATPPTKPASSGKPSTGGGALDWEYLNKKGGVELENAMRREPEGWSKFLDSQQKRRKLSFS